MISNGKIKNKRKKPKKRSGNKLIKSIAGVHITDNNVGTKKSIFMTNTILENILF
jgi:hypothetical protein